MKLSPGTTVLEKTTGSSCRLNRRRANAPAASTNQAQCSPRMPRRAADLMRRRSKKSTTSP